MDLKVKPGETESAYIWRLGQAKDSGSIDIDWSGIAELVNSAFRADESEYRTEAAYRKPYQMAKKFYEDGVFSAFNEDQYLVRLSESRRKLEQEKTMYRDERNAWAKQNRDVARHDDLLSKIVDSMKEVSQIEFPQTDHPLYVSDNDVIVNLSDLHIGATFDNYFGHYDTSVARTRMGELVEAVIKIGKLHKSQDVYIISSGDQISGSIHRSVQVTNRENVVDQIRIATELISSFCYKLSEEFHSVYFIHVSGNHSRMDRKDDALHGDRLDDVVTWAVGLALSNVDNFKILDDANLDTSLAVFGVRGHQYVACHGDYDPFTKGGTQQLITMIRVFPTAIFSGHLHTIAVDEANGIKMVRGGSLAGSGDDFTIEKRLSGKASQIVCIADNNGLSAYYPIEFE